MCKAGEGKTGDTKDGTDHRANRRCERKFEDALRTIKNIFALGESIHQPRAGHGLEGIARGDGK